MYFFLFLRLALAVYSHQCEKYRFRSVCHFNRKKNKKESMYIQDDLLTLETLNISLMFDNKQKTNSDESGIVSKWTYFSHIVFSGGDAKKI